MAQEVNMPRQGQSVESCLINEWKVAEGDKVSAGDILCEVETDKATFEVEAPAAGTILSILRPEGDDVPVLDPIAVIGEEGEEVPSEFTKAPAGEEEAGEEKEEAGAKEESREKAEPAAEAAAPKGEAKDRRGGRAISPRARNLAQKEGIAVDNINGSGPGGRIIVRDVEKAIASGAAAAAPAGGAGAVSTGQAAVRTEPREITLSGIRKLIAERMHESLATTAQLTLNGSADARSLMAYRKQLKASPQEMGLQKITINDMLLFLCSRALLDFKELNRHFTGDKLLEFDTVHLSFAVDTPRGLMVPVIRNAQTLSLKQISEESKRLSQACLEGNINPDELSGATFTITNLGALGIESFTPVLNPPQVGILGVCTIQPKPVNADDGVEFIPHIGLSLTINHQAVDGAPGARFLKILSDRIADFSLSLAY